MNRFLWVIQILLALLFLFTGTSKLMMSSEQLGQQMPGLSGGFLHFIAVCEILGALALVLPRLLKTAVWLTPLAAALLVIIMIGAAVNTLAAGPLVALPIVTGVLCIVVAWGRRRVAP
ncbi:MAG TPA: DoxX family protein [Bryobacteraceae bacterium]|nr:DoxX family protein [Bryobacteraceae bacterium]